MPAVLIMDYCERNGIAIPERDPRFDEVRQQSAEAHREKVRKRRDGDK